MSIKRNADVERAITNWLYNQIFKTGQRGFVIGLSGGIDSAVVATLCAKTNQPTTCLILPIHQNKAELGRAKEMAEWLKENYSQVKIKIINLSRAFDTFKSFFQPDNLVLANIRSRLRMVALYGEANESGYLVVGTGNKIEDYGCGFFTKHGDGGVDISPIGNLLKGEVYSLAKFLGIPQSIQDAAPTDGLWPDGRTDEQQLGAPYSKLDQAMVFCDQKGIETLGKLRILQAEDPQIKTEIREKELEDVLPIYLKRHEKNAHKMTMPPVCPL